MSLVYEIISTHSWNVLGTFDDLDAAKKAFASSLDEGGASDDDLMLVAQEVDDD